MITNSLFVAALLLSQVSAGGDRYGNQSGGFFAQPAAGNPQGMDNPAAPAGSARRPAGGAATPADPYSPAQQPNTSPSYPAAGSDPRWGGDRSRSTAANGMQYGNGAQPSNVGSLAAQEDQVGLKPSEMMRAMLAPPTGSRLTGRPVTLAEVVSGAGTRQQQTERVDAYWDLCASMADYYLGLREQEELRRLRSLVRQVGPSWQEAESELGVRIGTSQRAAVAAQLRLASYLGPTDPMNLPLPADIPHCGDYHTRYDIVFAGRAIPEAEQLRDLLPLRYEELKDSATAVTRSEEWVDKVATNQNRDSEGIGTLRSLELLALRRRAFVQIARDYNRRIARYAELAAPNQIDPNQLVSMLIKTNFSDTANRGAAPPGNRQSQNAPIDGRQTFADQWEPSSRGASAPKQDEAVEPASGVETQSFRAEQSLLVKPEGQPEAKLEALPQIEPPTQLESQLEEPLLESPAN